MRDTEDNFLTERLHATISVLQKENVINKIVKNALRKGKNGNSL